MPGCWYIANTPKPPSRSPPNVPLFGKHRSSMANFCPSHIRARAHFLSLIIAFVGVVKRVGCSFYSHLTHKTPWSVICRQGIWQMNIQGERKVDLLDNLRSDHERTVTRCCFERPRFQILSPKETVRGDWDVGHFEDSSGTRQTDYKAGTGDTFPLGTERVWKVSQINWWNY